MNLFKLTEDITKQELHENIGQVVILNYLIDAEGLTEQRRSVCGPLTYNGQTERYMVYNVNADDDLTFSIDNVREVEYTKADGSLKIILV